MYLLRGNLTLADARFLAEEILAVPLCEEPLVVPEGEPCPEGSSPSVDVALHGHITDLEGETLLWLAHEMGIDSLTVARSGRRILLEHGDEDIKELLNPVVDVYIADAPRALWPAALPESDPTPEDDQTVTLLGLDPLALDELNRSRGLALSREELAVVQDFFSRQGRNPTEAELETIAQTWSEHCSHKTFKAKILYCSLEDPRPRARLIGSLFGDFIVRATRRVRRPWIVSAFEDNAGIVRWDPRWDISVKVETHNHPSAIEPFGGASTGVGGVLRDILAVSAQPIAALDVLAFGQTDVPPSELPPGILHPQRIFKGVVRGIADYGNKVGIPTVAGAIFFHRGYNTNPLVYCGAVGLAPAGSHRRSPQKGDLIVLVGGRTGRDGLRGATFSSLELAKDSPLSAVQVGDPIVERKVLEFILRARDEGLYHAITDCGAGGLSSAIGEMGAALGVQVDLGRVPLKHRGMKPWHIWLSESQERMVLAVPPTALPRLEQLALEEDVEISTIGSFVGDGRLRVACRGRTVVDLPMGFLHEGRPPMVLEAEWQGPIGGEPPDVPDPADALLKLLSHPNIASKEQVLRRYDFEVQGRTAIKPLAGPGEGPADGVAVAVGRSALAIGIGFNPLYGLLDPRSMAWAAVDEALRNVVAVGADPDRTALLDNFSWGSPRDPKLLGQLVRCAQGCYEAAMHYRLPFVSGKDSLYNEYIAQDGSRMPIPGSLLVTAVGWVPDLRLSVTSAFQRPGNFVYILGETANELGGSHLAHVYDTLGDTPPQPPRLGRRIARALYRAVRKSLVEACHDVSEGGVAVALAEMALASQLGVEVELSTMPWRGCERSVPAALFAESLSRYLVEVSPDKAAHFEAVMQGLPVALLGKTTKSDHLSLNWQGKELLRVTIDELSHVWHRGPEPW
jgi:phosphoribosylformylglycinamidine synthase